jgi:hypothetical protein
MHLRTVAQEMPNSYVYISDVIVNKNVWLQLLFSIPFLFSFKLSYHLSAELFLYLFTIYFYFTVALVYGPSRPSVGVPRCPPHFLHLNLNLTISLATTQPVCSLLAMIFSSSGLPGWLCWVKSLPVGFHLKPFISMALLETPRGKRCRKQKGMWWTP